MKSTPLVVGGLVVGGLALAAYAWSSSKTAAAATGPAGKTWKPVTDLTLRGGTYRMSTQNLATQTPDMQAAAAAFQTALTAQGFNFANVKRYDTPPADWPASDTGANRTRSEFTLPVLNPPVPVPNFPGLLLWHLE